MFSFLFPADDRLFPYSDALPFCPELMAPLLKQQLQPFPYICRTLIQSKFHFLVLPFLFFFLIYRPVFRRVDSRIFLKYFGKIQGILISYHPRNIL